jgi:hypothetical protein
MHVILTSAFQKVTLGYEPFRPSTLSDVMRTHVRLFLTNKVNYQKVRSAASTNEYLCDT